MKLVVLVVVLVLVEHVLTTNVTSDVVGKLVVGYLGYYSAKGDGSPINKWNNWVKSKVPSSKNVKFEMYPDMREYPKQYETKLGNLGNGQAATLFSSWDDSTVDIHFKWMQENNIDTVALKVCNEFFFSEYFLHETSSILAFRCRYKKR